MKSQDFLSDLASSFPCYRHRVKAKSQRQSETAAADQQRKSNLDLHYEHFIREMQADEEDSVHSDYMPEERNRRQSTKQPGSPESSS